jgi:hypothetical protein
MDAAASVFARCKLSASGALCLTLVLVLAGCGGMRESRRNNSGRAPVSLGLAEPPSAEGAAVRSQDSGRPLRRLTDRGRGRTATAQQQPPQTQWSDPSGRELAANTGTAAAPASPRHAATSPALLPAEAAIAVPQPLVSNEIPPLQAPALEKPAATAPAGEAPKPAGDLATIRGLINQSRTRLAGMQNYQARMTRQERVGSTLLPVEDVVLSVRREPFAVRLEWPDGPSKGREAIYSARETSGKLQVHSPGSLVPRVSLDPNSPLVLKNSRHPITEAGLENLVATVDGRLAAIESGKGDGSVMTYKGLETVNELGRPCHMIVEKRADGQTWLMALDSETMLPAMVKASAADGNLLELYYFRNVHENVAELASNDAFSPDTRWNSKTAGLFGRVTR